MKDKKPGLIRKFQEGKPSSGAFIALEDGVINLQERDLLRQDQEILIHVKYIPEEKKYGFAVYLSDK